MEGIVIVLGQYLNDDGSLSLQCTERCFHAYSLISAGKADTLLLSGGRANKLAPLSEAEAMQKYFLAKGISPENILLETQSKNTYENAKFSTSILKEKHYDKIFLVSSSYHIHRWYYNPIRFFNGMFGLKAIPSPCFDSSVNIENINNAHTDSFLIVYHNEDAKMRFMKTCGNKNVFSVKENIKMRDGKIKELFTATEQQSERLCEHIKNLFGINKPEIIRI